MRAADAERKARETEAEAHRLRELNQFRAQLMNAVSAKLYVLVRAEEPTGGVTDNNTYELGTSANKLSIGAAGDNYRRQLFTQTIRLANVSGRRETP